MSRQCCINELRDFATWIMMHPADTPTVDEIASALRSRANFLEHVGDRGTFNTCLQRAAFVRDTRP